MAETVCICLICTNLLAIGQVLEFCEAMFLVKSEHREMKASALHSGTSTRELG